MIRLRTSLLLLAVLALLLSGTSVFAGTGDSGLPSWTAAPAASSGADAGRCPAPKLSLAASTPARLDLSTLAPDFILCSCDYCRHHPDAICRISPTGFSIVCSNYSQTNCP
ncbi:MAG: hypothetical protein QOJ16_4377 [Acidobacteriota bacterium]|jgi:hypothetical protein|nr:hypothetical protein [Acidobacteriota bacterium]